MTRRFANALQSCSDTFFVEHCAMGFTAEKRIVVFFNIGNGRRRSFSNRLWSRGRFKDRLWRIFNNRSGVFYLLGAQNNATIFRTRFDPTGNFLLGDLGEHVCIRGRRLGTKVAIVGCEIAEVFGNGFHRPKGIIEPFESARESAIRHRQDCAVLFSNHTNTHFCSTLWTLRYPMHLMLLVPEWAQN